MRAFPEQVRELLEGQGETVYAQRGFEFVPAELTAGVRDSRSRSDEVNQSKLLFLSNQLRIRIHYLSRHCFHTVSIERGMDARIAAGSVKALDVIPQSKGLMTEGPRHVRDGGAQYDSQIVNGQ